MTGSRERALLGFLKMAATAWCIWVGPLLVGWMVVRYTTTHGALFDFRATIWEPGRHVLHGQSPYPSATLAALSGRPTFVYPPLLLWLDVPMALLPYAAARILWGVLCAVAIVAAMRVLGVRDRRCYGLALLALPTIQGLLMGNVTILLVLALALAWRYRDHPWGASVAVGLLIGVKLLLWPLLVWLLVTRRVRSAALAVGIGAATVMGSWAVIGFSGLRDYPRLLEIVSDATAGPRSLSISVLAQALGVPSGAGKILQWTCGALILALAAHVASRPDGDRRAFSAVVLAALVISPVVWLHYLVFLLVPLALLQPRLGAAWFIPWAFWWVLWVPKGDTYLVHVGDGRLVPFGVQPSPAKLVLVLGLLATTLAVTAGHWKRGRLMPAWVSLPGRLSPLPASDRD
jgi:hypothetical protein